MYKDAEIFQLIFDSYLDKSLKAGERANRLVQNPGVIHLATILDNTKVPEQMSKFWNSESNKINSKN